MVGTATYVDAFIPDDTKKLTVEQVRPSILRTAPVFCASAGKNIKNASFLQLADIFVSEVERGMSGTTGVRCGIIGEMGCSHPLTPAEEKGLQAGSLAQKKTGAY